MSPENSVAESASTGISRRRALKRIGSGAAIAWTAPVLMSIRTPAFAQYPTCRPFDCLEQPRCGQTEGCPENPPECQIGGCALLNDGSCICSDFGFCSTPDCTSDADCESQFGQGYRCGPLSNCGCPTGCWLPCGASGNVPRRKSLVKR